jgi:hypothetical protein
MITVAGSPVRPRVPAKQRFTAGHLAGFPDQSGTAAALWAETLSCPGAYTDATTCRALRPVRPTGPLSFRCIAAAGIQTARMRVADSALRVKAAFARWRLALPHL